MNNHTVQHIMLILFLSVWLTSCTAWNQSPSFTDTFLNTHTPQYTVVNGSIYKN